MRNFSQILKESNKYPTTDPNLDAKEMIDYSNEMKKDLGVDVRKAIYLTAKHNITSAEVLDKIRNASKSALKDIAAKQGVPVAAIEELWNFMKTIKNNYKKMPQYLSADERKMILKGTMRLSDVAIDLSTPAGRNAAAKEFYNYVLNLAKKEVQKHPNMNYSDAVSSAMEALNNALNDYKAEPDEKTHKVVPFHTYLGYRVVQQIKNDANQVYQTLSGRNAYNMQQDSEKYGSSVLYAVSLDGSTRDIDSDDFSQDHLAALGSIDKPDSAQEERKWNQVFKALDSKFSQRDMDIFYRRFGINNRKKESGVDVAKSLGVHITTVANTCTKIIKFLKSDTRLKSILRDILDIYTESLMPGMLNMTKNQINESLACNDIYVLLVEATKWEDKDKFINTIKQALKGFAWNESSHNIISELITGDFEMVDAQVRKNNKLIRSFLSQLHPTQSFAHKTDGDLIEYITEIQEYCHKYKLESSYFKK